MMALSAVDRRSGGFTLIELLVVTLIVSVAVGAIGACLAAGIRIFEVSRTFGVVESRAHLALIGVERDLRNSSPYADMGLLGGASHVRFTRTTSERDDQGRLHQVIQLVSYQFDTVEKRLTRRQSLYSPSKTRPDDQPETVLRGVRDVRFEYLDGAREDQWRGEWNSVSNRPAAVRVSIAVDGTSSLSRWQRLVTLPVPDKPQSSEEGPSAR